MKILVLVVFAFILHDVSCYRQKRNLVQFARMIKKITGRSGWAYNNYGCWCGSGGSGRTVDGVDRCCKAHDHCYDRMVRTGCSPKWVTYGYRIRNGQITCNPKGKDNACKRGTCECDRTAVYCFRSNPYNPRNKRINKKTQC